MSQMSTSKPDGRLNGLEDQVDDVKGQVKENIEKVIKRSARLTDIEERTALLAPSHDFRRPIPEKRRRHCWENIKCCCCCCCH